MKRNQQRLLLLGITACLFFSGCAQKPYPICPTVTLPYVKKQSFDKVEVTYELIR